MTPGIPLLDKIPAREIGLKIQSLLPARRHSEILDRIDASLLLFDNILINTADGASAEIQSDSESSFPAALALTARALTGGTDNQNILLLLPTADFIATSYSMNMSGEKLILSALELQSQSLIPAYEEELLLAVDASSPEGVALWFNEAEANRLFRAFDKEGLFLGAIMPRSLAVLTPDKDEEPVTTLINDEEGNNISFMQIMGSTIKRLLTVNRKDLDQEVFAKQWELETSQIKGDTVSNMNSLEDWKAIHRIVKPVPQYSFLPAGALAEEKRINFARRSKAGMAVAACLVLLLLAPFVSNWMTLRGLQSELERAEEQSAEVRNLQASIFDMEEEWGALDEYPDQEVGSVLVLLNDVIQSSLTSFSINKGVVDISGSTADPAYLVELLAEKEQFYNVGQSTLTRGSGTSFGIRLNLSSVDFEAYEEKYPLITQGR